MKIETKFDAANSWLIDSAKRPPFSQSFEWEEILSREGKEVERITVLDKGDKPLSMALVEYYYLPFGLKYAFCPKGPVLKNNIDDGVKNEALAAISEYLKDRNCIFLRMEPSSGLRTSDYGFRIRKSIDVNPRATMILDLKKTPDELLAGMHQKTRYNINLSLKKDLRLSDQKDADLFVRLMKETAKRDKFRLHKERHYHEIIFSPLSYQLTIYSADKPVASAVFTGFGNTFTYLFGASCYESRAMMAPYLIQWEGIKMAQRFGYRYYDFFGIAPQIGPRTENAKSYEYDPKHQYAGVSRFKQGFGGEYYEEPGTFDLIISPWKYRIYGWLRMLRRFF